MNLVKKKIWLVAVMTVVLFFGAGHQEASAQYATSGSPDHPDAIAVRVVPNPSHYSIVRWYESQGFRGSPQALIVDGYEAIRDGRTVYVNAANVDSATKNIYTNIYLISYNQDSAAPTVDILGQLVSRWKFNSNLSESDTPICAFSSLSCATDADCADNQLCSNNGPTAGSCVLKAAKNCLVDTDCPASFFCSSLKARITRDIKRVGQLEELKEALSGFQLSNSRYPLLAAGTYLSGHSISVWPSWSQELLSDLAVAPSFRDPVNRIGPCVPYGGSGVSAGYDPATCWNAEARRFINEPAGSTLALPAGSYAFIYSTDHSGSAYNLCATMESRSAGYRFSPNDPADSTCLVATGIGAGGLSSNTPPWLTDKFLVGEPNAAFNGYIRVADVENDSLTWSWSSQNGKPPYGWSGWISGGQTGQPPRLIDTSNPYQKKIYAERAGQPGTYDMTLRVTDGRGGVMTTSTPIMISSDPISLEAADAEYEADLVNYFSYRFTFSGNGFTNPTVNTPVVSRISGPFNLLTSLSNSTKTMTLVGGKYQIEYRGLIPVSHQFPQDVDFRYSVSVTDSFGATAQKTFTIRVKASVPPLNFSCPGGARLGKYYDCLLGSVQQGNHSLNYYESSGYPAGLNIYQSSGAYLRGTPTILNPGQTVTIRVINEYRASNTKTFLLRVNNYCGDGIKQFPNTEGRGGLYNDGYEDCDGTAGVATSWDDSRFDKQYGCGTTASSPTSYPILTNDKCVFLSPSNGGGYCGDGYCQVRIGNQYMERLKDGTIKCLIDCSDSQYSNCVPSCTDRSCGNDGCGGSCGVCGTGQVCSVAGNCINSACLTDNDCNDSNPCTIDTCINGGASNAYCQRSESGHTEDCVGESWYPACVPGQNTICSTGTCKVTPTRSCVGTVFGSCGSSDPRPAYCTTKCEGETDNFATDCSGGTSGRCRNTGNGSTCAYMGEVKTCSNYLGWPAGSWIGNASCNNNCTGYNTSSCAPNVCETINPRSPSDCYWYKAPDESVTQPGTTCMIKMPTDSSGNILCVDYPPASAIWQWYQGKIHKSETTFCRLPGCPRFVNPNKCRYLNNSWSNQCYVPIN